MVVSIHSYLKWWFLYIVIKVVVSQGCLSSDYDEHDDLSTGTEDLADTDSEGSVHHLGIEPYQYKPNLSDPGAGAGEDGGSKSDSTGSDEDDEGSERLGNNEWLVVFYS